MDMDNVGPDFPHGILERLAIDKMPDIPDPWFITMPKRHEPCLDTGAVQSGDKALCGTARPSGFPRQG
jgi:hypothetical protein